MTGNGFFRNIFLTLTVFALSIGSVVKASTVRLLHSEVEAFAMRLERIKTAQSTIDLISYEISDDNTSGCFLVAMLDAVERGVVVRVLVDGHIGDNLIPKPLMHYLIEHGVAIRERPLNVRYQSGKTSS